MIGLSNLFFGEGNFGSTGGSGSGEVVSYGQSGFNLVFPNCAVLGHSDGFYLWVPVTNDTSPYIGTLKQIGYHIVEPCVSGEEAITICQEQNHGISWASGSF